MDGIRAVLFDFGGVFTPSPFAALDGLSAELGAAPGELMQIVFGPYDRDTDHPWHRLERGEIPFESAREEIRALGVQRGIEADPLQIFARMDGGAGAREGLVERTRALRQRGFGTALVTNNAREFRDTWTELIPVEELFQVVIDSSEVGLRKPNPEIFQLALRRLGDLEPREALFLDDFPANVEAAKRLGIRGVLVETEPVEALRILDRLLAG